MAQRSKKLPKKEVEDLFYKLCVVVSKTNDIEDAARLLRDLLSSTEAEMIAKRIKIAEKLIDKATYREINEELKTSNATIFKVQEWLNVSGDGYRKAIETTKGRDLRNDVTLSTYDSSNWADLKRKLPMYFWPQIVLENIIATANKKQQDKIKTVLRQVKKMEEKHPLYERIDKIMASHHRDANQRERLDNNSKGLDNNKSKKNSASKR